MNFDSEKTLLFSYKLLAKLDQISSMAEAIKSALHFYPELIFSVNLCLEELITNTISYGLKESEKCEIEVSIYLNNGYLEILIEDNAPEFNPFLSAPEPDIHTSLSNKKIGGLGVYLVKKMMDNFNYSYNHYCNQISLFKKIS